MIGPRFRWVPKRDGSLGAECVAFWRAAGGVLDDWQEFVVDGMLGLLAGRFASLEDGLNVARQNGKGVVLQAIEAFFAFELGYPLVMHTAHEFATSQEHQLRLEQVIQNAPHLHSRVRDRGGYVHANGQESIRLKNGCRIGFKARTKAGGRGYSGDLLVWDEAMVLPDHVLGAQMPMLRASTARFGPKIIYAGSAVDQELHEYGVTWTRVRERGIAEADGVSYHEWSAPLDSIGEVDEAWLNDRSWWPLANPAMEVGRISAEHMQQEIASLPSRTAAVELGGVGDWPRTDGLEDTAISIQDWDGLFDKDSQLQHPVCVAFDVSPERRTAVAVAGRNLSGEFHVEIHRHSPGTGWLAGLLEEMQAKWDPELVVCDSVGPAASLLVELREADVRVETVNSSELAQACGRLIDMVDERELRHLGSAELRDAIRGAKTRPIGDGVWAWGRRSSTVDISPLVAATLALGAAAGVTTGELAIF